MNTKNNNSLRALTLIEVIVIVAVLASAVAFLCPALSRVHVRSGLSCENCLKQVGLAFRTWEGDYGDRYPMSVPVSKGGTMGSIEAFRSFQVMSNEFVNLNFLVCPADTRKAAKNFKSLANLNVSYFVGLGADERFPAMPLTGDRNLVTNGVAISTGLVVIATNTSLSWSTAIHNLSGNVGLADGSVQQTSSRSLQQLFQNSGTNIIRLAVP